MLDHLTPQALVFDRQATLRRDADGLRHARLARSRFTRRRRDGAPNDTR